MIAYADEMAAYAAELGSPEQASAREWASPLNGPLRVIEVTSCSDEELQPHMNGRSTHGPYRH
jgi:hypothetical protein